MKYRIAGILTVTIALVVSFFAPTLAVNPEKRVHQHLEYQHKPECTRQHSPEELCTHLPLVVIDTAGQTIPGKTVGYTYDPVHDRTISEYSKAADGDTRILASMKVVDNSENYNHAEDSASVQSNIRIRVRGRSSRNFDKSSYAITLVNEDLTNNDQSLMGMDAHHEWILYGPYLDKTDLRNYMFYNLSGEIMDYAPNVRYCEVILNGQYEGLYVLTETITAGKDGSRLDIEVSKKYQTYTGYVARIDQVDSPDETTETFSEYTWRRSSSIDFEILYPGSSKITPEMERAIAQDFSDFEKALYSYDFDDDSAGYKNYIDVESFVDAFLISEITANYDFGGLSTYVYKGTDNRFRICMWDFNNACDNFIEKVVGWRNLGLHNAIWYEMLFRDEDFTEQVIERYRYLRKRWFSDEYLSNYMTQTQAFLGEAILRDRARWESTYETGRGMLEDPERNPATVEEATEQLKTYLSRRLNWLDENIESLRQYSAESKVKKFEEVAH